MNWISNFVRPKINSLFSRREVPENLWSKCDDCGTMLFHRELSENLNVCTSCGHHMALPPRERFAALFDGGIFTEIKVPRPLADPLHFRDQKKYPDRMRAAQKATNEAEAMLAAEGEMGGTPIVAAAQDFRFMGGSMGMYVGNAIIAAAERAVKLGRPLILFSAAGGARMQEGILSLMQMPRSTVAVEMLKEAGLPYIVVLTHPTTGGVTASYAMLGDVQIAEPNALICFAGPRVIEQTIREKLPEGFQRAEYLLDHGMLDRVTHRLELRDELITITRMLMNQPPRGARHASGPGSGRAGRGRRDAGGGGRGRGAGPGRVAGRQGGTGRQDAGEGQEGRGRGETGEIRRVRQVSSANSDIILERMMSLHPKVIDLVLDRVWRLLAAMDHPERRLAPVIHLAGTNGKGSTQAMIRAGLEAAGHRVHAYTSPHLARFHERIRLAGTLISEAELSAILEECERANDGAPITYFEITTVAALVAFSRYPADYCLLEVGLGGRLDATNVVERPALTVITPVSLDHQQYLGDTLAQIAGEKAGILKRGVPCIVGPQEEAALAVIEAQAARVGAPLLAHGQHWHLREERGRMVYQDETGLLDLPLPGLLGAHQVQNAGMALAALRRLGAGDAACEAAVTRAEWPARMQRLRRGPLVDTAGRAELWLDGGHNPAAGDALAEALSRLPPRPLHLVCGMLNTKDVTGYLRPLARVAQRLHAVSIPGADATLPATRTAEAAQAVGMPASVAQDVARAIRDIVATAPNARILICGSLYLAGDVLKENG